MAISRHDDRVVTYRGAIIENTHRVHAAMTDATGNLLFASGEIQWAVDGCNLPAAALPLRDIGCLFAKVAAGADAVEQGTTAARSRHLARIFNAMWKYPDMVGGKGRFCTKLVSQFQGGLIRKLGADKCYGIAIRESEQTRRLGAQGAVGISVKIEDGNIEILYAAVMEILQRLEIGTQEQRQNLCAFHYPALTNTAGETTGRVTFDLKVRSEGVMLPTNNVWLACIQW
ncbi:L-asparaginase II-domain-containing protein [Xylaria acuta]|nr:L-asparaginase II-domain-containing protein [Xylaria acuta]